MRKVIGDLWTWGADKDHGRWTVIPTNAMTNKNGEAIMGKGLALQAKKKFPKLARYFGSLLPIYGATVIPLGVWGDYQLIAFPTKYHWEDPSDMALIEKSCRGLLNLMEAATNPPSVVILPCVGTDEGKLTWQAVEPILESYLDDRFVVIERR